MSESTGIGVPENPDELVRLMEDLRHLLGRADALGMTRVFVHPLAGVLSAYGMGLADQNVIREQAVHGALAARLDDHSSSIVPGGFEVQS